MKVTNDGRQITLEASFREAACITEAIRKAIPIYRGYGTEGADEMATELNEIMDKLINPTL